MPSAGEDRSNWKSHTLLEGMQNGTDTLEIDLAVSYQLKHIPPDPAFPLLGMYRREVNTEAHVHICTGTFLQIDTQLQNSGNNQSSFTGGWVNQLGWNHTTQQ